MARQCRLASPGVLMRLGLAVVFFSVSISWKVAALDEPVANSCSDPSYSWAYNSQGQSPCQVASEVMQPCGNTYGKNECYCNPVTYSLWAACSLCNGQSPHSFGLYFNDAQCGTQYSSPPSDGPDIPSWASIQLINDDTFDVAAAKQEAGGAQPSNSASTDGHAALPSTRSPSPHSSDTPDRSPTNPGGSPTPSPSQSSSAAQSSMPSPPTDVVSQQTSSLPNHEIQTGSSPTSATAGRLSGPQPAAPAVSGQSPPRPTAAPYTTGFLQSSRSGVGSPNTEGRAQPSTSPPPTYGSIQSARGGSRNHMGAIIAGAVASVVLLLIAAFVALCVVRRRRRRRNAKEALIASGPLEWWMRPGGTPIWHPDPEQSECRTIEPEPEEAESEVSTLPGDDVSEKKSVKYGNYPDF